MIITFEVFKLIAWLTRIIKRCGHRLVAPCGGCFICSRYAIEYSASLNVGLNNASIPDPNH
jgi:hypothetical protein